MIETEERTLVEGVKKLTKTLADLLDVTSDRVVICGPSRHVVVKSEDGKVIAKLYRDHEKFTGSERLSHEHQNLASFRQINNVRGPIYREVTGSDFEYLGLPDINTTRLDTSRLVSPGSEIPIALFNVIPGRLLYDTSLEGQAKFEDYLAAAVQIARIQQEGKLERDFKLENVVRDRSDPTSYFMERFNGTFLKQLATYGGITLPQSIQEEMAGEWETLVAENLVKAHRQGFTGYYFDGNPKHHLLGSNGRRIVSLDYEDRLMTPSLLGLASLLHFGLGKDGKPLLSEGEQGKILDRYLFEVEFVNALRQGLKDRATRISDYINRAEANGHDLAGTNPDEYFRFLGKEGDRDDGVAYKDRFLASWRVAVLDRQASWLAHKARYRAVAEILGREEGFRFEHADPIAQNAEEQMQHLRTMMNTLEAIKGENGSNGRVAQNAAVGLSNKLKTYIVDNPYFLTK